MTWDHSNLLICWFKQSLPLLSPRLKIHACSSASKAVFGVRRCTERQSHLRRVWHVQSVFMQRPLCARAERAPWLPSARGSHSSEQATPEHRWCPRHWECHAGGSASLELTPRFHVQLLPTPTADLGSTVPVFTAMENRAERSQASSPLSPVSSGLLTQGKARNLSPFLSPTQRFPSRTEHVLSKGG